METFANLWQPALQGAVSSSAVALPVAAADLALLPPLGLGQLARVYCEGEWMTAYGADSTNQLLYVRRGQEGSAAAGHAAGRKLLQVPSAGALKGMQSGAIIDRVMKSGPFDTMAANPTWAQLQGMSVVVPAGLAFTLEFESEVTLYQNSAVQYNAPNCDFKFTNSAGTLLGASPQLATATARYRHVFASPASGSIVIFSVKFSYDFDPLAAADVLSVQATVGPFGTMVGRVGETQSEILTARAL